MKLWICQNDHKRGKVKIDLKKTLGELGENEYISFEQPVANISFIFEHRENFSLAAKKWMKINKRKASTLMPIKLEQR